MGQVSPTKGTIKLQILMDLGGSISTLIFVTHGRIHEVNLRDDLLAEPGALYILVRGYVDFARLYKIHRSGAFFIIRAKSNFRFRRLDCQKADKAKGVQADQIIELHSYYARKAYPHRLRRVHYYDTEKNKRFPTILFCRPPRLPICFAADGRSSYSSNGSNSICGFEPFKAPRECPKDQVWIAISVHVLVAIIRKKLQLKGGLFMMLQISSVSPFLKTPLFQLFSEIEADEKEAILLTS
jgi:hypothetical protein